MAEPVEDVTEVIRRHQASGMNKTLAFLLGLLSVTAPAVAGYYSYRKAKIESALQTKTVHDEASVGYRTLADPIELMTVLARSNETRLTALEAAVRDCTARQSLAAPAPPPAAALKLVPLDSVRLLRPLPKTLGEATALAQ